MKMSLRAIALSLGFGALLGGPQSFASLSINGAGSTFAEPLYTRLFSDYQKIEKNVRFNYQGTGSGAGMKQLLEGTVDFAGTDDPMKADDGAKAKRNFLHIPMAMGAVVVSYNLPQVKTLRLSGAVLAQIFNGKIQKWNAPEITKLNPGVSFPDTNIAVATRSDGSGTTAVFSEYLSKVSPEWVGKNGKTVKWFGASLGAKGNAGVTGLIKQNLGTIGYVELVYALENKLPVVQVQNKKGEFIEASTASVTLAGTGLQKEAVQNQFKISLTNSEHKGAYPISAFTWLLLDDSKFDEKGKALFAFAHWALGEEAQKTAAKLNYAAVPKDVRAAALKSLDHAQSKAQRP